MVKLNGRDAAQFCARPNLQFRAVLIHGEDEAEIAVRRVALTRALIGDGADSDMGLTRLEPSDIRRDPSILIDALKAQGFFGGQQVVTVEGATDAICPAIEAALEDAREGDAFLVVTAGILTAKSKLRKLFEGARNGAAAPCYADVADRGEIERIFADAGGGDLSVEAVRDLAGFALTAPKAVLRDVLTRLALYTADQKGPVGPGEVMMCLPGAGEVDLDETIDAIAAGKAGEIGPLLSRLMAQGQTPISLVLAGQRYFRRLHTVLVESGGRNVDAAIGALRPPVFGPRRDALAARCRNWRLDQVEGALSLLVQTDNDLRGGVDAPGWAMLERALLKLALTADRNLRRG